MHRSLVALLAGGLAASASAHHSNDYHFDRNVGVTVAGTVNSFRFINPHARLLIDVTGEDGQTVTWNCEMAGAIGLARRGWTDDIFQPGEAIVIEGFAARRSDTECYYDTAVLGDGRQIAMSDSFDANTPPRTQSVAVTAGPSDPDVPNFTRVWRRVAGGGGRGGPQLGGPNAHAWVLSEAGKQALAEYDPVLDDPALTCSPVSIVRLWGNGDLTEIEQSENLFTIRHEWMDAVREVHLGMQEHPADQPDSVLGHSIGRYEGSTLVIDTVGFTAGVLHQHPGLPHSNQLHTVERLTLGDAGDTFELSYTAEDSLYFTDQLTGRRSFGASGDTPQKYNCTHLEPAH